jgi:hypothetical protein
MDAEDDLTQKAEWDREFRRAMAARRCPYSGGPLSLVPAGFLRCGVCDCYGFDADDPELG